MRIVENSQGNKDSDNQEGYKTFACDFSFHSNLLCKVVIAMKGVFGAQCFKSPSTYNYRTKLEINKGKSQFFVFILNDVVI